MKLYDEIKQLLPRLHGWCSTEKGITLANIILATKPEVVAEFGVWGGRSLFPMALAMRELGRGKVIAVDPWNVQASVEGQTTDPDVQHWRNTDHEVVFRHFTSVVEELKLQSIIDIHRCKSEEVELPANLGLFHLDNNHGEQAYNEALRIAPRIAHHGFMVLDDLSWSGGHVQRAADWMQLNGFVCMHTLGTGAVYCKL